MRLLVIAICLLLSTSASAQNGPKGLPTSDASAADYRQMPFSVLMPIAAPDGWSSTSNLWLTAIWNRNASGCWYRNPASPNTSRPSFAYLSRIPNLQTTSWTCYAEANYSFRCHDNVRNLNRYFYCPASVHFGPPVQWRSDYQPFPNGQVGWFYWRPQAAATWYWNDYTVDARNQFRLSGSFVSKLNENGDPQLNCQYSWNAVMDQWLGYYFWPPR